MEKAASEALAKAVAKVEEARRKETEELQAKLKALKDSSAKARLSCPCRAPAASASIAAARQGVLGWHAVASIPATGSRQKNATSSAHPHPL